MEFPTATILSIVIGIIAIAFIIIYIKFQKIKKGYIHNHIILIEKEKEIKTIKEKYRKNKSQKQDQTRKSIAKIKK